MLDIETKINNTAPASTGGLEDYEFNSLAKNIVRAVERSGIALSPGSAPDTNYDSIAESMAKNGAGGGRFYQDSGSANNYVLMTPSGVDGFAMPKSVFDGMEIKWIPDNSNDAASTVNPNGIGTYPLVRSNGDPLQANDIIAGVPTAASYNDSTGKFHIDPWALKEAAEVSGTSGTYLYLPLYPEILTNNGLLTVNAVSVGNLEIPTGQIITHRGWRAFSTDDYALAQRQFTTAANKTYHLRWSPANGFELNDLANGGYNAGALDEDNIAFDSTFDNALCARVVTDGSNVATITQLKNCATMDLSSNVTLANVANAGINESQGDLLLTYNWSRKPKVTNLTLISSSYNTSEAQTYPDSDMFISLIPNDIYNTQITPNRYRIAQSILFDLRNNGLVDIYDVNLYA